MKYYLVEITTGDAAIAGKAVYEYETLNEAVANFHSKLGSAMKSTIVETELLMVINSDAGIYEKAAYTKDTPEISE